MKSRFIAAALFAATGAVVALFPYARTTIATGNPPPPAVQYAVAPEVHHPLPPDAQQPRVEVVFVLDTTASMGGLIEAAKEKIWSIASTMAAAEQAPQVRMGLVAFRDRGDAYVTRVVDLSSDLDSMFAALMDFRAEGGGDGPESVNQALHDAVHRISWSQGDGVYRAVFLVGDAPPHMDYPNDVPYTETVRTAAARGIVVNAIQCGNVAATRAPWQTIAQLGHGSFFEVDHGGSAVAIATPFDDRLARLSRALDGTRLYYGSDEERARKLGKLAATEKLHEEASVASRARRAAFNATTSGEANLLGDKELVDDVARGRVVLESIAPAAMPEPLRGLAPELQQAKVQAMAHEREKLRDEIAQLSAKRDAFLEQKVEASGVAAGSLDEGLFDAVRRQAAKAGLRYDADARRY